MTTPAGSAPQTPLSRTVRSIDVLKSTLGADGLLIPPQAHRRRRSAADLAGSPRRRAARSARSPPQQRPVSPLSQAQDDRDDSSVCQTPVFPPQIVLTVPDDAGGSGLSSAEPAHDLTQSPTSAVRTDEVTEFSDSVACPAKAVSVAPFNPEVFASFAESRLMQFERWREELRRELAMGTCDPECVAAAVVGCLLVAAHAVPGRIVGQWSHAPPKTSWEPGRVVAFRPAWCEQVTFTYRPVGSMCFSSKFSSKSRAPTVSPDLQFDAQSATHCCSPRIVTPEGLSPSPRTRAVSPRRRTVSPLRGGGALCGGLIVRPVAPRHTRLRTEY
eukprot:TRINITY_DN26062_c0_g1_i4.p1 TRINITY_DN26062_c0_g1~~TRINITY_DN26062_c0_g1_i4.p1  ORF type:complete len:329 (+),score=43.77 TRINITY_DN26062_c0_g1_i4:90-1076(+)